MQRFEHFHKYLGHRRIFRTLNPAIVPIFIVYVFLQVTITTHNTGSYFQMHGTRQFERQPREDNSTDVYFVTRETNDSIPDEVYFRLTRAVPSMFNVQSSCTSNVRLLRGFPRETKGYLTLGLTTVPRDNAFYLPATLESLLSKMTPKDRNEATIVVFLGSLNNTWVNLTLAELDAKFTGNISSGLIQVIQPEPSIYPDFSKITKRNFNDTSMRVHWRTKQNIDYAYLFAYCEKLSDYYIHVEDDVTVANGYVNEIKKVVATIENSKLTWFLIEFSSLGFIGKLFRSSDLCTMKDYFLLFKDEKPCDLLINDLKRIKTQVREFKSPKSLFQHFGISSSLKGKIQKLTDKNFKDLVKRPLPVRPQNFPSNNSVPQGDVLHQDLSIQFKTFTSPNPQAQIVSSMQAFGPFSRYLPYLVGKGGYFLAKSLNVNDFYRIVFKSPVNMSFVHIATGHPKLNTCMLQTAIVKFGKHAKGTQCTNAQYLGSFEQGQFSRRFNETTEINCVEIVVTKPQKTGAIIYEIRIEPVTLHENTKEILKNKANRHKHETLNSKTSLKLDSIDVI